MKKYRNNNAVSGILYQVGSQNLAFLKNLRWNILYFSFLIYGALVALDQIFENDTIKLILITFGFVSFAYSIFMIIDIQCKLQKERISISSFRNYFLKSITWTNKKAKYIENYKKFSYDLYYFIFPIIANAVGFTFLVIILYFKNIFKSL